MKQFFKFTFASMLGFFLAIVVLFFLFAGIVSILVSSATGGEESNIKPGSILHLSFNAPLVDRSDNNPFSNFDFSAFRPNKQPGLNDIISSLEHAKKDSRIAGIYLDLTGLSGGLASLEALRNALLDFRTSKKFILAYADYYGQGAYYLATTADQVWLNPEGELALTGFSVTIPFLKDMFSRLEVEPQVIRHGKFKSAVEPLIRDEMSDENREQVATYVNAFWNHFVSEIGKARGIPVDTLAAAADRFAVRTADDAHTLKLVDRLGYFDEFREELKRKTGASQKDMPELIPIRKYAHESSDNSDKTYTRDRIAVIYATGEIVRGEGDEDQIGSDAISETIRKAREDDHVKAVVLRVNSPGGDALASEVIWREMKLCRDKKPVVVSMGNVAASGGYYISCNADTIVAQPNTVTGSIGVFGVFFNAKNLFSNKLGIHFDTYKTSGHADIGTALRPLTESEIGIMQGLVEKTYSTFMTRVADGRHMPVNTVDSIGQGRVWSGSDAYRIGLVDVLGGLDDAVKIAAKMAGIDNYRISELPEQKEPFAMFVEEFSESAGTRFLQWKLGDDYDLYRKLTGLKFLQGIQARTLYGTVSL